MEAETALDQGHPNAAVEILKRVVAADLPIHLALPLVRMREAAMQMLLTRGEGSAEALRSVRAQRAGLEAALAEHTAKD